MESKGSSDGSGKKDHDISYGSKAKTWETYLKRFSKVNPAELVKEYQTIRDTPQLKPTKVSDMNEARNRYGDIPCIDETRVVLGHPSHGYINANYVNGYAQRKKYIITQGPLDWTTTDFWELVWQQEICLIIMLCECVENGKERCAPYWPRHEGYRPMQAGRLTIQWKSSEKVAVTKDARLLVVRTEMVISTTDSKIERIIHHMQFEDWPDHGVPMDPFVVIDMCRKMGTWKEIVAKKNSRDSDKAPILVHCSAGIGRSGVLVAVDIIRDALISRGKISVETVVRRLREQRLGCIQKPIQYLYLYASIFAYLNERKMDTTIDVADLWLRYKYYCDTHQDTL